MGRSLGKVCTSFGLMLIQISYSDDLFLKTNFLSLIAYIPYISMKAYKFKKDFLHFYARCFNLDNYIFRGNYNDICMLCSGFVSWTIAEFFRLHWLANLFINNSLQHAFKRLMNIKSVTSAVCVGLLCLRLFAAIFACQSRAQMCGNGLDSQLCAFRFRFQDHSRIFWLHWLVLLCNLLHSF